MKRVVASSVVSVIILLLIAAGFFYYQFFKASKVSLVSMIPADVTLVVRADAAGGDLRRLAQSSFLSGHDSVELVHTWYRCLVHLDSSTRKNPILKGAFESSMLILSGHVTGPGALGIIYYLDLNPSGYDAGIVMKSLLPEFVPVSERTYKGIHIFEWINRAGEAVHWMEIQGVLTASTTAFLLEDVIRQQSRPASENPSAVLQKFIHSGQRRFEVALRYSGFSRFIKAQLNEREATNWNSVERLGEWSLMSLHVQPNRLLFQGESLPGDSLKAFLNVFKDMKPGKRRVLEILPLKTAALINWKFDDPSLFLDRLTALRMRAKEINSSPGEAAGFASWMGDEVALLLTQPVARLSDNNYIAFVAFKDSIRCLSALRKIAGEEAELKESYSGYFIRHMNRRGVLASVFGPLFNKVNRFYYIQVNGFLVVANQASTLRAYINDIKAGSLVQSDTRFKSMEATIHQEGNLLFFADIPQSEKIFSNSATPAWVKWLAGNYDYIQNWNGVAFSVSNNKGRFDTRGSIGYFNKGLSAAQVAWNFKLDSSLSEGPFVPAGSKGLILVQDKNFMLYAIDHQGSLKWKRRLETSIMGKVHAVDYLDNGSIRYLFNTHSFVYLIDSTGANVGRYPFRLPAEASAGMSFYSIGRGRDQNQFSVPCLNLRQYNYSVSGLPVQGNSFFRLPDVIVQPPQYQMARSGFFLIDRNGRAVLTDRYGNRLQTLGEKFLPESFQFNVDSTVEDIVGYGINTSGKICLIRTDGTVQPLLQENLDSIRCFATGDVNSDGMTDWIVGDSTGLSVITPDGLLLFRFNSANAVEQCAWQSAGKKQFISASAGGLMYLFNPDGTVYEGFPLRGEGRVGLFTGHETKRFTVFREDSVSFSYVLLPASK